MTLYSDKPDLQTNKGIYYSIYNKNTKRLLGILKKYQLESISHAGVGKDTIFTKTENLNGLLVKHNLYYHIEEEKDDPQHRWLPLTDNFYYYLTYDADPDGQPIQQEGPTQGMYRKSEEEAINGYKELLENEESNLVELMDWLYKKEGSYYLYSDSYFQINKGLDYGLDSKNTKRLLEILKKYQLESISHAGVGKDTIFTKHEILDGLHIFHQLIYYEGADSEFQQRYVKLAENFYYRFAYGE